MRPKLRLQANEDRAKFWSRIITAVAEVTPGGYVPLALTLGNASTVNGVDRRFKLTIAQVSPRLAKNCAHW